MPGLKSSPSAVPWVYVRAPEQARLAEATPPPMCACAVFDRWHPTIDSPLGVSQYAVEPSASTLEDELLVLPAQRPASPEIAESPIVTTVGVPTPGPSAFATAGPATALSAVTASTASVRIWRTRRCSLIVNPSPSFVVRQPHWRAPSHSRGDERPRLARTAVRPGRRDRPLSRPSPPGGRARRRR